MKKNEYEILGLKPGATDKQIRTAFEKIKVGDRTAAHSKAVKRLLDPKKKTRIDNKIAKQAAKIDKKNSMKSKKDDISKKSKEILNNLSTSTKKVLAKPRARIIATLTTGAIIIGGGSLIASCCRGCGEEKENRPVFGPEIPDDIKDKLANKLTPTPTLKPTSTPTPKPTVAPTATPTPAPTVTPTPIDPETVEQLNSKNIDVVVDYIVKQNQEKGFNINPKYVKSALLVVNLEDISLDELSIIAPDFDKDVEIEKADKYISKVNTHNTSHTNYGNDMTKYVGYSNLVFNKYDKTVIEELENYYGWVTTYKNEDKLTEKQYTTSLDTLHSFYKGRDILVTSEGVLCQYDDMTMGGKWLCEKMWSPFDVVYTDNKYATDEMQLILSEIDKFIINGVRWNEEYDCYIEKLAEEAIARATATPTPKTKTK